MLATLISCKTCSVLNSSASEFSCSSTRHEPGTDQLTLITVYAKTTVQTQILLIFNCQTFPILKLHTRLNRRSKLALAQIRVFPSSTEGNLGGGEKYCTHEHAVAGTGTSNSLKPAFQTDLTAASQLLSISRCSYL